MDDLHFVEMWTRQKAEGQKVKCGLKIHVVRQAR